MSAERNHDVPDPTDRSAWSALVDGELSSHQCSALLRDGGEASDAYAGWEAYHVIGDVLRGERPLPPYQASSDFLAGVRARLERPQTDTEVRPVLVEAPELVAQVRGGAANDPAMRWKWVAGFASLTAVVAVSWTLVGQTGSPASGVPTPLLVQAPAVASPVEAPSAAPLVVVKTEQGRLIRDPALERMLAEHRQHGAMTALQMPAGFLRNATYDDNTGQ